MTIIRGRIDQLRTLPHIGVVHDIDAGRVRAINCAEKAVVCFKADDLAREVRVICITYAGQDW